MWESNSKGPGSASVGAGDDALQACTERCRQSSVRASSPAPELAELGHCELLFHMRGLPCVDACDYRACCSKGVYIGHLALHNSMPQSSHPWRISPRR